MFKLWTRLILTAFVLLALLLGAARSAQAAEKFCSDYGGVIDGNVLAAPPTQITIDTDCTFQNFPQSNPLTTTVNFQTNDPTIYLIVFDNVTFIGNMACANVDHRIWFSNGSDYGSSNSCQDLFIPVETIHKQAPATTAAIGAPFTYTLTLPSMNWPVGDPSTNDLHTVVIHDDLTATGVDLTYVDINAYYKGSGDPVTLVPEDNPLSRGGVWTPKNLSYKPIPLIPAGDQIVVEITVSLDNAPTNAAGTSFTNTAKWWFGRLIDGQFYEPLPGEWGISQPMTIAEPDLVVTKTSDETALNLGIPAIFTIDVQNTGGSDAWNAAILDQIPDGADAGMCDYDPTATVTARLFRADDTLVADLTPGTDYSVSYSGCQLGLAMLTDKARIAPEQHLTITYQSQLDADTTGDGIELTNVAGATEWFSAGNNSGRTYTGTLSDGTPTIDDHQDSQTVTAALSGYYFQKTVENLTSHASPAATAAPGDRLRYRLRLFNVDQSIDGIMIGDPLDLNSLDPSTFSMVTLPAGAEYSFSQATGLLEVSGDSTPLNVAVGDEIVIEFEITLASNLTNNTVVANQASLSADALTALSDDPHLNGIAPPGDPADPTTVVIQTPGPPAKANTRTSATIGERFTYRITVPSNPTAVPLYDVRILDDLSASSADMRFVSARVVSGGTWTLSNTGTDTSPVIEDMITGIDVPANGQAVIEITVELLNTTTNNSGLVFDNRASYTYNRANGVDITQRSGGEGGNAGMTVVEPAVTAATKTVRFISPAGKPATDPATVGDVLEYVITIPNSGSSTAFDNSVVDTLPANLSLVPDSATARINGVAVTGFKVNPSSLPGVALAWGRENGDGALDIPEGQSLVLTYQVTVVSVTGADINNSVYVDWTSLLDAQDDERTGEGCPSTTAPNDYCVGPVTATVSTLDITSIAKSVVEDSYAEIPASTTDPIVRVGDTVTYELTLNLQEYTTRNVVVEDALPAGMALESATIDAGSNFSYALAAQPAAGATGTLSWEFGDIANQPSNDGTPTDALVIRYVAIVVTDAPPTGAAYEVSIPSDNVARLSYTGGDPAVYPDRLTATERVEVRQPRMSTISKVDLGSGRLGTGTAADPYQIDIASDVMNFRLSSCNDGQAPAYGVVMTDLLAPEFDESGLTANPPIVKIGAATLTAGTHYAYTAPASGGEMRIDLSEPVHPGECATVDYNIGFHTDLAPNQTWSNQARLPEYRSLPAQGRLYGSAETARVWMTNVTRFQPLSKTLASPAEATIGEEVVYRITVPAEPVNAVLDNVVVTDTLHGALEYLGATAVDMNGATVVLTDNSSAPDQVSLAIDRIPAGRQAIITLRTRVANNDQANAGTSFANTASYSYAGMPPGSVTGATSAPLTVIEPLLTVAKAVSPTSPKAGDLLTCTLSFTASGAGAGDDYSNAFDLTIEDSLGLGLAYVPGSATVDGAALDDPLTNGADGAGSAQALTWSPANGIDIDIAEGATVTVAYQVRVLDSVAPGQTLTNSVIGRWTGLNGDRGAIERTGGGTPAVNDYFTQPVTRTLTTPLAISFVKSAVNATTGENSGANARPGDTLRYTLVLANESIVPVSGASVTDELAAQFAPGSLQVLSVSDANAVSTNSNAAGGGNGTGIVDIRNLTLGAQGEAGDTVTIVFDGTLAPVIPNGTIVLNQAQLLDANPEPMPSNQTSTLIASAPAFDVWKTSTVMTGDPAVLMAGETLRYTIAVKNVGTEDAKDVRLRDDIPAHTTYVANSTTLNGAAVLDVSAMSPLQAGMLLNSPESGEGYLPADATPGAATHVATVTFDVVVDPAAVDGLIIENQGFVSGSGVGGGIAPEKPSDDPDTSAADDPTRDIVGNLPLLITQKTVRIAGDSGTLGSVDPGDVLLYTITIRNDGATPATGVVFIDQVPADTAYVADSLRLNGAAVGTDGGVSPLIAGLEVQSSDRPGTGIISGGERTEVTFEVRVNDGVPTGTLIGNQGSVVSSELPTLPTDADGDPANGYQPTQVVVGDAQQLAISKEVSVIGGGTAQAGGQLQYVIRVTNIGTVPATDVVITDDLSPLGPDPLVPGSATLDGLSDGISYAAPVLTAAHGVLPPGATAILRFRADIDPTVPMGTTIANTAAVTWNADQTDSASASVHIGGIPGSGILNGSVWHDANLDRLRDGAEQPLDGWSVELYRGNHLLATALTDGDGVYRLSGLAPNDGTPETYELRFRAAGEGPNTATLGYADSPFTNGPQRIAGITVASGGNLRNLNLPLSPNGAVYNSVLRAPVAGARVALLNATNNVPLPSRCFDDPAQQNQVTARDGYYKLDLNFSDAACQPGAAYLIEVTPPRTGYVAAPSRIIPPNGEPTDPFSVPACLGSADDAAPASAEYCEVVASASAPPLSIAPRTAGTAYHLYLTLSDGLVPGESQVFNNHIPVDPELDGAVAIAKTSSLINVTKGQLVPYTITVNNVFGAPLQDIGIADRFPPGFKYVQGSSRLDGEPKEPIVNGRELVWDGLELQVDESHTLQLLLVVGAGVSEGEYVNRAQVLNTATGGGVSGEATATVRVVPDPTFDCTDVIGKVFDDRNLNGYQDEGEQGLAGVRVVTARGLIGTTDAHGRFHIACAVVPDEDRGSNFILKLDDRSLPTGYRVTTENPRVQRATRGKMMKFNFGATIHRVVAIDIADGVFEPETAELRLQWQPRIARLLEELRKAPSVLRLSYLADVEGEALVKQRLKALKREIAGRWGSSEGGYRLTIETEVFWRRGGPVR